MESLSFLSTEYLSQVDQRLISVIHIFEESYNFPIAGSLCGAFLPVQIFPHQTYILSPVKLQLID